MPEGVDGEFLQQMAADFEGLPPPNETGVAAYLKDRGISVKGVMEATGLNPAGMYFPTHPETGQPLLQDNGTPYPSNKFQNQVPTPLPAHVDLPDPSAPSPADPNPGPPDDSGPPA